MDLSVLVYFVSNQSPAPGVNGEALHVHSFTNTHHLLPHLLTGSCSPWQTRSASLQQPLRKPRWTRCSSSPESQSAEWLTATAEQVSVSSTTAAQGWRRTEDGPRCANMAVTTRGYFYILFCCSAKQSNIKSKIDINAKWCIALFIPPVAWVSAFMQCRITNDSEEQRCVSSLSPRLLNSEASRTPCRQQIAAGILSSFY